MKCTNCGKRILFWYKTESVNMTLCTDCFKKSAKGKKVKWMFSLK